MPDPAAEDIPPRASVLAESLRAFGYDLGTAIADLVDNSISAGARKVWVDFVWAGKNSCIAITDDGRGMSEARLRDAMRLGSQHPGEKRAADDLGRFGLGLKTASFSQCRCVTVCTKEAGQKSVLRRWDLDHLAQVDQWQVLLEARSDSVPHFERLNALTSGTCVLWQQMDRVLRGVEENRDAFIARCEEVERHLALVFHRLLESPTRLRLFINDHAILPFDPFFISAATQELPVNHLPSTGGTVIVEPFVMPHESKLLDEEERRLAGDPRDWTARQGFYIYRQDRLLVPGSWLGYRDWRKDEHHKLARIRVSLPNTSDEDWQIDVTKSKARPPLTLREELRRIGKNTREKARRVYSFRGERIPGAGGQSTRHVWDQVIRHGRTSYLINRQHPAIAALLANAALGKAVESTLQVIEQSIPTALIAFQSREEVETPPASASETATGSVRAQLHQTWLLLRAQGSTAEQALQCLALWPPFNDNPELLQALRENPPALP
ncbi:MAG: ATP-binding protein [Prosthecobacter sp.]